MPSTESETLRAQIGKHWYREIDKKQWKVYVAAYLGWGLDFFDLMLFYFVMVFIGRSLKLNTGQLGLLASAALIASAFGGLLFGFVADRFGRKSSMILSIFIYAIATGLCGVSHTLTTLMVFRVFVGLGIGGEWSTGVAWVSEVAPKQYRVRILSIIQSANVVGVICAVLLTGIMVPRFGWRSVFLVGVLPALLALWISWGLTESDIWSRREKISSSHLFKELVTTSGKNLVLCTILASLGMIGYWAIQSWVPTYLAMPVAAGGRGLNLMRTTMWIVTIPLGGIVGHIAFGFIAEKVGLKITFVLYLLLAAIVMPLYFTARDVNVLLYLGPIIGVACAYYAGFAAYFPAMFPTRVRGTGQGVAYNVGRAISGLTPAAVGGIAMKVGMGNALLMATGIFVVAALFVIFAMPNLKHDLTIQ